MFELIILALWSITCYFIGSAVTVQKMNNLYFNNQKEHDE